VQTTTTPDVVTQVVTAWATVDEIKQGVKSKVPGFNLFCILHTLATLCVKELELIWLDQALFGALPCVTNIAGVIGYRQGG